jgi:antitoxin (DNA-binding transcriptional repressor) of toxin-antitoxin stability system
LVKLVKERSMTRIVSRHNAKTHRSALVAQAASGAEVVIARNGVPQARLIPVAFRGQPRQPANAMRISRIAQDIDAPNDAVVRMFEGTE